MDLKKVRDDLRQLRRGLSELQQQEHGQKALDVFKKCLPRFQLDTPKSIAVFLSRDGELDTSLLIRYLWQADYRVYLPVLNQDTEQMLFVRYEAGCKMRTNRYGIAEPQSVENSLAPEGLDLVIVPLVGFDAQGNRLGMGGGFYDKTFGFKIENPKTGPRLIGWAHSCQQLATLPAQPWDVPLDAMVTEKGWQVFNLE